MSGCCLGANPETKPLVLNACDLRRRTNTSGLVKRARIAAFVPPLPSGEGEGFQKSANHDIYFDSYCSVA
jgi:hypothetical protein